MQKSAERESIKGKYEAGQQISKRKHRYCKDYGTWPVIAPKFCNGTRQSPINIVSAAAKGNDGLVKFSFLGYSSTNGLKTIENTGKTVKVTLDKGIAISGGNLSESYDSLEFLLHWGNGVAYPGSEHTVDGKRYPMELHIVNIKSSFKRKTNLAVADSKGIAALGFFIEELPGTTDQPSSWKTLTSYFSDISLAGQKSKIKSAISLDDLLSGVDRSKYYRYLGSLTTPPCNEAVVWTVFKEPIKVSKNLIDLFSTMLHRGHTYHSPLMVNVFRGIQPAQPVSTQPSKSGPKPHWSLIKWEKMGFLRGKN
ncbi:carbonic anhydrase 4-like [Fundulus diaphanus]